MNGMYGMSTAEQLIAINHMQVAANHAVPSGAMPFQEVLRVYGEDQITGVGSCIDQEKRKIKKLLTKITACGNINELSMRQQQRTLKTEQYVKP